MGAPVSAIPSQASSACDRGRGAQHFLGPPGNAGAGERLHAEAGTGGLGFSPSHCCWEGLGNLEGVIRARRRKKLLVVLTATKVRAVLGQQGSAHCAANQPGGAFETAHGKRETSSPV